MVFENLSLWASKTTPKSTSYLAIALILLSPLVFMDVSSAASSGSGGRVFSDDFEDGTVNAWSQDDYHKLCTVVTTAVDGGPAHNGTRMTQCNWNGLVVWNDPEAYRSLKLSSFSYSSEFLIRFWVRADADVDHAFGSKWFRLYNNGGTSLNSFIADGQMENGNGQPMFTNIEFVDGGVSNYTNFNAGALGDKAWHKIEFYFKIATGGGAIFRAWNNDVLTSEKLGWSSTPSNKWFPMYLMSNWSADNGPTWAHDAANHIYWDEFEIFSDTGTGGTGLMSDGTITQGGSVDATPPAVPVNLRIQ